MGNTDSVPVVSQAKSLVQYIGGDSAGALRTQQNFAYNNTFPVISQIASAGYAIGGDNERALDLQKKFADDMQKVVDSIPVAGHIKGGVHYALGQNEEGDEAMKAASRSTGVVLGGVGGFAAGGPFGAIAGGVAGGAAMDGIITGSEILINGEDAKPSGYVAMGHEIANAVNGGAKITPEQGFDMALVPVSDGLAGYGAGRMIGKPLGLNVQGGKTIPIPVRSGFKPPPMNAAGAIKTVISSADDGVIAGRIKPVLVVADDGALTKVKVAVGTAVDENANVNNVRTAQGNYLGLEKKALDNRANQLNPNHQPSGPGRPAGYRGLGSKTDLDNHSNQLNPNHLVYKSVREQNGVSNLAHNAV